MTIVIIGKDSPELTDVVDSLDIRLNHGFEIQSIVGCYNMIAGEAKTVILSVGRKPVTLIVNDGYMNIIPLSDNLDKIAALATSPNYDVLVVGAKCSGETVPILHTNSHCLYVREWIIINNLHVKLILSELQTLCGCVQ